VTYPPELQAYFRAHDEMIDAEHSGERVDYWALYYGLYKVARYNAVKAGYLPETPEFG